MMFSVTRVRCTGHFSAISRSFVRCSSVSSGPSNPISSSMWSSLPSLEAAPIGHGLREGRLSQRYRVQAFRMSRPTMMIEFEKATQKLMTCPRLSVHHTSFL
jgi:hypothetical protein